MTIKEFNKAVATANFGARWHDKHVSPDFQCDLTGGMPVCLVWNKLSHKCWLEYPDFAYEFMEKEQYEINEYEQILADWGVKSCVDISDFNSWLDTFGEENVKDCYLFEEEQE